MNLEIEEFLRSSVRIAVDKVFDSEALSCKLSVHNPERTVWVSIELAPPRHGCGFEEPGLVWVHSNSQDLFAGTGDSGINKVSRDRSELIEALVEFYEARYENNLHIETIIIARGSEGDKTFKGSSETGLIEACRADLIP